MLQFIISLEIESEALNFEGFKALNFEGFDLNLIDKWRLKLPKLRASIRQVRSE
jgi:hypothetical protein